MAIGTNDLKEKFGTQDLVSAGSPAAILAAAVSASTDVVSGGWTNDDDAPTGEFVLKCTFATAPTALKAINLYARPMNLEGTNDPPQPDATYKHEFIGLFLVDGVTTAQTLRAVASLANLITSQIWEFYIENKAGQTISAGWALYVTPVTVGPA